MQSGPEHINKLIVIHALADLVSTGTDRVRIVAFEESHHMQGVCILNKIPCSQGIIPLFHGTTGMNIHDARGRIGSQNITINQGSHDDEKEEYGYTDKLEVSSGESHGR